MNRSDKREVETVLQRLCVGTQVVGARWFMGFTILIEPVPAEAYRPDLLLLVESRFTVFPTRPAQFPDVQEDLPELSVEQSVLALIPLAGQRIVTAELGDPYSHLILTFESGQVLFVNGFHPLYESWTLQDYPDHEWMVISLPGGDIASSTPESGETVEIL